MTFFRFYFCIWRNQLFQELSFFGGGGGVQINIAESKGLSVRDRRAPYGWIVNVIPSLFANMRCMSLIFHLFNFVLFLFF